MTTIDGTKLTKNHIIFRYNNRDYTKNINGDERLNVFKRNLMNIYLEQFEDTIGTVTYDDIIYISTLENHDTNINDLPSGLKGLFIMSSMCREIIFSEYVKQNIEFVSIDKTNIHLFPNIQNCINLHTFKINHSNISEFNIDYELPSKLRDFNVACNCITNVNTPFSYNQLTSLLTRNKNVKYSFSDNYLNYDLFPEVLRRKCNLLRQNTYKYNPIHFHNVAQINIRNFVADLGEPNDNATNNILNSTQTVHLSSVNKSVVSSVAKIKEFITKHNIDIAKLNYNIKNTKKYSKYLNCLYNYESDSDNSDSNDYKTDNTDKKLLPTLNNQQIYNYFVNKYDINIGDKNNSSYLYVKHSITELTYKETFELVWSVICYLIKNDNNFKPEDLLERLYIELKDGIQMCYTGKYNRLINSLVGIIDGVYVGISSQEEIQMEFGKIIEKLNKIITPNTFSKALCEAKEILRSADEKINKSDWLDALYDLAPAPIKIKYNSNDYLQTWDDFILDLSLKDIIGFKEEDRIIFID